MDNFLVNALLMILQELIDGHEDMLGDTELNCFRMIRNVRASSPTINDPIQAIHRSDLVVWFGLICGLWCHKESNISIIFSKRINSQQTIQRSLTCYRKWSVLPLMTS